MSTIYADVFAAYDRASALLNESQHEMFVDTFDFSDPLEPRPIARSSGRTDDEVERLHTDAYAEDLTADNLASIIAIYADNLLQTFSHEILERGLSIRSERGFGPLLNGITFTCALRATTNSIRHVDEWKRIDLAKLNLEKPMDRLYPPWQQLAAITRPSGLQKRALDMLQHIEVIQNALNYGPSWFLQEAQPATFLAVVDGKLGGPEGPSYVRFENAIIDAACAVATAGDEKARNGRDSPRHRDQLEAALDSETRFDV